MALVYLPETIDLGLLDYRVAWDRQLALHAQVLEGHAPAGFLLLVEHPPVVTIGRHPGSQKNLLATPKLLEARGVQLVETDRGGDITFHGPGQLVAYPIVSLNHYGLNLHAYMRLLEETVIRTIAHWGLRGQRSQGATGVWVDDPRAVAPDGLAKICAMGVKLRRWITLHGLALNVTTDLTCFDLINPCGLGRPVTSLQRLLGEKCPTMAEAKKTLAEEFRSLLGELPGQDRRKEGEENRV